MQAVRLARYHTRPHASRALLRRLSRLVGRRAAGRRQSGAGARDLHAEGHVRGHAARAAHAHATSPACWSIRCRRCIRTPNAPGDSSLVDSGAHARTSTARPTPTGCSELREVCTERGIVLIFDEVFVGFRLAPRRRAGILRRAGRHGHLRQDARRRPAGRRGLRPQRPDEALPRRPPGRHLLRARHVQLASLRDGRDARVPAAARDAARSRRSTRTSTRPGTARAERSTQRLRDAGLPVRVANLSSIWTVCYTQPSRYNWMLQYYLRAEGLALSWVGTGRLIFSLNYTRRRLRRGRRALRRGRARRCSGTAGGGRMPRAHQQVDQARASCAR